MKLKIYKTDTSLYGDVVQGDHSTRLQGVALKLFIRSNTFTLYYNGVKYEDEDQDYVLNQLGLL